MFEESEGVRAGLKQQEREKRVQHEWLAFIVGGFAVIAAAVFAGLAVAAKVRAKLEEQFEQALRRHEKAVSLALKELQDSVPRPGGTSALPPEWQFSEASFRQNSPSRRRIADSFCRLLREAGPEDRVTMLDIFQEIGLSHPHMFVLRELRRIMPKEKLGSESALLEDAIEIATAGGSFRVVYEPEQAHWEGGELLQSAEEVQEEAYETMMQDSNYDTHGHSIWFYEEQCKQGFSPRYAESVRVVDKPERFEVVRAHSQPREP